MSQPMPALIGHRGLPLLAPENTRSSFQVAAQNGIDWVEVDVTIAGDDSLVIMHDPDLTLFERPDLKLINMDEQALRQVDAGRWFNEAFTGEPLLFLPELLLLMQQLNLKMNLEIKVNPDIDTSYQVKAILDVLKQYRYPTEDYILSSFSLPALRVARETDPDCQIAVLFEHVPEDYLAQVAELKPVSIHCDQSQLSEQQALNIREHYPLYCYTVNDTVTLAKLFDWGINGVFSDRAHAEELRNLIPA